MKTGFFSKIAVENLRKNTRLYIPRILAEAGLLGCFYILLTLALDSRLSEALGGSYLKIFMMMGTVIIGLLSFIIILYINRFLMKQRKSEYGLYNVLGMEKRHIIRILFCESLYTSIISVIAGVIFGILFYKLSSLLICRLLRAEIVVGFYYLNFVTVKIMEKIGMEQHEVRKTIGSQIRLQMFLPLVTAAVHMVFVFPILLKLLNVLMLSNTMLFVLCTVITFAVFACVYTAVYFITSKIYYKIVH